MKNSGSGRSGSANNICWYLYEQIGWDDSHSQNSASLGNLVAQDCQDDQSTLNESLSKIKPSIVFTSSPTVYMELIMNHVKVVLINDINFFTNYPLEINYRKIIQTTSFKNKDFKKKLHNVPTKFFGRFAENRIYRFLNET